MLQIIPAQFIQEDLMVLSNLLIGTVLQNHHKAIYIYNWILYSGLWVSSDFVSKAYTAFLEINMKYKTSL